MPFTIKVIDHKKFLLRFFSLQNNL